MTYPQLFGSATGGLSVAAVIVWLTKPPPVLAVVIGGLCIIATWIAAESVITWREQRAEGGDDGDSDDQPTGC